MIEFLQTLLIVGVIWVFAIIFAITMASGFPKSDKKYLEILQEMRNNGNLGHGQ